MTGGISCSDAQVRSHPKYVLSPQKLSIIRLMNMFVIVPLVRVVSDDV